MGKGGGGGGGEGWRGLSGVSNAEYGRNKHTVEFRGVAVTGMIPRSTQRDVEEGCICMRSRDWRGDDEQVPIQAGGTRLLVQCTNGMGPMPTTSGE